MKKTVAPKGQAKTQKNNKNVPNHKASNLHQKSEGKVANSGPKTVEKLKYKTSRIISVIILQPIMIGIILSISLKVLKLLFTLLMVKLQKIQTVMIA